VFLVTLQSRNGKCGDKRNYGKEERMWQDKILSGRFILTIACAMVFVKLAFTGKLDPKDVMTIVVMVFTLYFTRNDRNTPTTGGTK
jgi:hypothetical protein